MTALPDRPLRVVALIKQVPVAESLTLDSAGRLQRDGLDLEMNPYCRRAVSKAVELARISAGRCTVMTLGPPAAEDILRESVVWGADNGIHLCDPIFAGSDTLATARALAAAIERLGPVDLILLGKNSVDGETGQIGPELAELLHLPFAGGVRCLNLAGEVLQLELELDDGIDEVHLELPAVLSVAERLCEPCKVPDKEKRAAVAMERMQIISADQLGPGPWGANGSPTVVGSISSIPHQRCRIRLSGDLALQIDEAVRLLEARHALHDADRQFPAFGAQVSGARALAAPGSPLVAVVLERGRPAIGAELLFAARQVAMKIAGSVVGLSPDGPGSVVPIVTTTAVDQEMSDEAVGDTEALSVGACGGDELVTFASCESPEDVAHSLTSWASHFRPWAVLAPSTAFGREVAGRTAAALGAGLVGDAIDLRVDGDRLIAAKPAFSGALVADIAYRSYTQMVTVRPGALVGAPLPSRAARRTEFKCSPRSRVRLVSKVRNDDVEILARARVVIGVGSGVSRDEYDLLLPLAHVLAAELGASRKVTDKGWLPKSRQIGITGRSISPRLYVAVGVSGKFNHMVGVRRAKTVLCINNDPMAPVFEHSDIGIVGDWHLAVSLLTSSLNRAGLG